MWGRQEAIMLIFVIWGCFDCRLVRFGGAVLKVSFAFSFLVLLKERRTQGQSKILSVFLKTALVQDSFV